MKTILPLLCVASLLSGCSAQLDGCEFDADAGDVASSGSGVAACPPGDLCLDLVAMDGGAVRAGRIAVVWYQLDPADPDPEIEIAFDRPIGANERQVAITPGAISTPKDDDLLLCQRACDDEAACGCRSEARVGIAAVVAADDLDGDGRLDAEEVRTASYGRGYFVIAHSEKEQAAAPRPLDSLFTDGITRGTAAYRFVGSPEERLAKALPGESLTMNLCAEPGPSCSLPFPELRGF